MLKSKKSLSIGISILLILAVVFVVLAKPYLKTAYYYLRGEKTVNGVIGSIENTVYNNLESDFKELGLSFPPQKVTFLSFKQEREMELWANENNEWKYIKSYPILGLSGKSGPKLMEGDRQVPEGIYNIIGLNPNSYYHLAMLINYPNDYDKENAQKENRTNLGGDICIHGSNVSAGCLAVGDEAIEELFYIVVKAGIDNTKVIIAPYDFRKEKIETDNPDIEWLPQLYSIINEELKEYSDR